MIDKVPHRCKFAEYGCEVKDFLCQLKIHEEKCEERTVKCPYISCLAEQQYKKYFLALFSILVLYSNYRSVKGPLGFHTTFTSCTTPDGKQLPEHNRTRTIIRFKKCSATRGLLYILGSTMEFFIWE